MKVYLETFGCTSNRADSAVMRSLLAEQHTFVEDLAACDIAVINSCAVIEHTQRKVLKRIKAAKELGKKVIVTGCLTKIDPEALLKHSPDAVLTPQSISWIGRAVGTVSSTESFEAENEPSDKPGLLSFRGELICPIPIAEGCLGRCTYCGTRKARGRLRSYDKSSILNAAEKAVSNGAVELQLTAQDTACYGMDRGVSLPELLTELTELEGEFRIRVGMMNPESAKAILDELLEAYNSRKIYKFLHLPIQSGDNRVLRDMRRGYTVEEHWKIVQSFRRSFPGLTLSTDVIVGYPTETEESFQKTCKLLENLRSDIVNITRFSPRPGTPAAELKDLPDRVKKERSRKLSKLASRISRSINTMMIDRLEEVLITEKGRDGTVLGRTSSYKQVVLRSGRLGELKTVRITRAQSHYLIGEEIET